MASQRGRERSGNPAYPTLPRPPEPLKSEAQLSADKGGYGCSTLAETCIPGVLKQSLDKRCPGFIGQSGSPC